MRLSGHNKQRLYNAISEPIMQKRIEVAQSSDVLGDKNAKDLDSMMFRLEQKIWREVSAVLNIKTQ